MPSTIRTKGTCSFDGTWIVGVYGELFSAVAVLVAYDVLAHGGEFGAGVVSLVLAATGGSLALVLHKLFDLATDL